MADSRYRQTSTVFTGESADQFRRHVLDSPSLKVSGFGEQTLRGIATQLEGICGDLVDSLKAYGEAHQGEAAEAAQNYIAGLVATGLHGHEKITGLASTMRDQTELFANVHKEIRDGGERFYGVFYSASWAQEDAGNSATAYEASTNESITRSLPVFDPPPAASVNSQVVGPATVLSGGSAAARLGAVDAGLAPASAGVPTEVAGMPGVAGGGSGAGAVGALGSLPVSPAADLGRGAGPASSPVLPGGSGVASVPGLPGVGSGAGVAPFPGASGRWGTQEGLGSRAAPGGGVIRPGLPRGGVAEGEPAPRARGATGPEGQPRPGVVRGSTAQGGGHTPLMPGAGGTGAGRGGSSRQRPEWLIEPDPDSYWLADVPPHGPAVIRPSNDDDS